MEIKTPGRRRGSKNYSREFRAMVVAQANDAGRSIAEVAQEHGLNANMVAKWRRDHERSQTATLLPVPETFLPVQIAPPSKQQAVVIVERGAIRVRLEGAVDRELLQTVLASLRDSA